MSSCLFAQYLPLFFYDLLLTISSRTHAEKHSIRYQPYFITRIDETCDRREPHEEQRRVGLVIEAPHRKNRAESAAKWPNITIFCFPHNQHLLFLPLALPLSPFFSIR